MKSGTSRPKEFAFKQQERPKLRRKLHEMISTVSPSRPNTFKIISTRFLTPTILVATLGVNIYSIRAYYMLCWECIRGVYLWSGGRAFPPQHSSAHKLGSCYLSHLPSNTESEHSTAPGSADRPGGNGVHTLVGGRLSPSCFC